MLPIVREDGKPLVKSAFSFRLRFTGRKYRWVTLDQAKRLVGQIEFQGRKKADRTDKNAEPQRKLPVAAPRPKPATRSLRLSVSPVRRVLAQGEDITFNVTVSTDAVLEFSYGSFPANFGVYILSPWGTVPPDAGKIRQGNWMHGQHSASKKVVIKKGQPFATTFKLSDYFRTGKPSVSGRRSTDGLALGRHVLHVKFYPHTSSVRVPVDSGPVEFTVRKPRSAYEKLLADRNIETDAASLKRYLISLRPTDEQRKKAESLIRGLGHANYHIREKSIAELIKLSWLPAELLHRATKSKDPEVRYRAQRVISARRDEASPVKYAAFQVIAEKRTPGLLPELLTAIPLCKFPYMRAAARRAALAAANRSDASILRKSVQHVDPLVRAVAAEALAKTLKRDSLKDLLRRLHDRDDFVQVTVARLFAGFQDRRSLPVLVAMLDSDDVLVRMTAATTLRDLTGQRMEFVAYDDAKQRLKGVVAWRKWASTEGKTARLNVISKRRATPLGSLAGHTLLAFGNANNKVAEYDAKGKEVWVYPARNPRNAEKLANGNVLISECSGNRIIEVTPKGRIVWQFRCAEPLTVQPLANGNVLIAQFGGGEVIEVNRRKETVWRHAVKGKCCAAQRLDSGNTLIAAYGIGVMEVTPTGAVVWDYAATKSHGCRQLSNGNILICDQPNGRVMEVTRAKKIVWECRLHGAVDALRLPNGNTLVSGHNEFVEFARNKRVVWRKAGNQYGTARR